MKEIGDFIATIFASLHLPMQIPTNFDFKMVEQASN